jgi:membrane-bound lytic murein transglycosylase A
MIMRKCLLTLLTLSSTLIFAACDDKTEEKATMRPDLSMQPIAFTDLEGWEADHHKKAYHAFENSCTRIAKSKKQGDFDREDPRFGSWDQWRAICAAMQSAQITDDQDARLFFETYFTAHSVKAGDNEDGLFTGYYVTSLSGSNVKTETYKHPIYAKPDDLVMVDLGAFRKDLKGRRIAGTVKDGRLYPYADRAEIETKGIDVEVLLWANDPTDVFFLHIQGSGRVNMVDGSHRFIGYAGQNGHPYNAIGKFLIEDGEVLREDMSMQAIRKWLEDNPEKRDALLNKNPSYVFFTNLDRDGAIGGESVVLTAERSLAIDHTYYPYGLPLWLDAAHPEQGRPAMRQLMIGQDTGGAIRGPVRGDVFWGYGERAEKYAGPMKSKGKLWALLPRQDL